MDLLGHVDRRGCHRQWQGSVYAYGHDGLSGGPPEATGAGVLREVRGPD